MNLIILSNHLKKNYIMKYIAVFILFFCCLSCSKKIPTTQTNTSELDEKEAQIKNQTWYAHLDLEAEKLPFIINMTYTDDLEIKSLSIINGNEKIKIQEIEQNETELRFKLPLFDNEFIGTFDGLSLKGDWYNYAKSNNYKLPLQASLQNPNQNIEKPVADFTGKWNVTFSADKDDAYPAIAEFSQKGNDITGTFLTETGDYRFLSGWVDGNQLKLAAFDGAHAFLFTANYGNETLNGQFYSGNHWKEPWEAIKDETTMLRNAYELTYLEEGYDKIEFAFPNLKGDTIIFPNPSYQNKVVIVQILGSWCPNCMDESRLYADLYKKYAEDNLEIIGLTFERPDDFEKIQAILKRYIEQMGIGYEILWAGKASKKLAAEKLPMLNHVMSFPTSIFIDKKGTVRKIHTGFSGPATEYYRTYVEELNTFLQQLLNE